MSTPTHDDDVSAADSYVAKWLAQEPEMEAALAFTGAGRHRAVLWGALLNEWLEATFELSDAGVAQIKLAWWGEALAQASTQSPHPLVRAFAQDTGGIVPVSAWHDVAHAALKLAMRDASPADVASLLATRLPLAQALAAVETILWPQAGASDANAVARNLVLRQWRGHFRGHRRGAHQAQPGWLPLQLLARHDLRAQSVYEGGDAVASQPLFSDLAAALLAAAGPLAGPRLRRIRTRLDLRALARLRDGHAEPFSTTGFGVVWQSWRAARGVSA